MSELHAVGTVHVPARTIAPSPLLSPAARAMLTIQKQPKSNYPELGDKQGWLAYAAQLNGVMAQLLQNYPRVPVASSESTVIGQVPVYDIRPQTVGATPHGVVIDIHGGAFILGGGAVAQRMSEMMAARVGRRVVSVDYRMPPEHPYPAALDDCMAVYRALLQDYEAKDIIVAGMSAGGNLAAALVLRARDEGLPLPAGALLLTPAIDLTESGDSFQTNADLDAVLSSITPVSHLYAAGHDLRHPYLSPLFADFSQGFVPSLITAGTRDLFLSNAVLMHRALRRADVHAELHLLDGASHLGFGGAPEGLDLDAEICKFVDARLGNAMPSVHRSEEQEAAAL